MCVELFHKDNTIALNIVHLSAKIALFLVQIGMPLSLTKQNPAALISCGICVMAMMKV